MKDVERKQLNALFGGFRSAAGVALVFLWADGEVEGWTVPLGILGFWLVLSLLEEYIAGSFD